MVYISIFKVLSFPAYPWLLVQNINLVEFFNVGLSKTSASIPVLSFASKALYQGLSASEDYTAKLDCTYGSEKLREKLNFGENCKFLWKFRRNVKIMLKLAKISVFSLN